MPDQPPVADPVNPEKRPPFNEVSVLFPILALGTVAYLAMITSEFFLRSDLRVPAPMLPVYIALLGAYAADKEIRRWVGVPEPPRQGSLFVYAWLLLFLGMLVINFFRTDMPLPGDLVKVVLQVLGIFFGSKASKLVHGRRLESTDSAMNLSQVRLMERLQAAGTLTRAEAMAILGTSRSVAGRILARMQVQGLIRLVGEGRGAYYVATQTRRDVSRE